MIKVRKKTIATCGLIVLSGPTRLPLERSRWTTAHNRRTFHSLLILRAILVGTITRDTVIHVDPAQLRPLFESGPLFFYHQLFLGQHCRLALVLPTTNWLLNPARAGDALFCSRATDVDLIFVRRLGIAGRRTWSRRLLCRCCRFNTLNDQRRRAGTAGATSNKTNSQ